MFLYQRTYHQSEHSNCDNLVSSITGTKIISMGKHLKDHVRVRILMLRHLGPTEIQKRLAVDGEKVGRAAIYNIFKKWDEHKTTANLPQAPRIREGVTIELLTFVNTMMEENDETTAKTLVSAIWDKFSLNFSISKARRLRYDLGWVGENTKYCQLIRTANVEKRLNFAKLCIELNDQFDDVVWTDESTIQLDWNGKITFRRW